MTRRRSRRRRIGAAAGLWALLGACFGLAAALVESVSLIVTLVVACVCALVMAMVAATTDQAGGVPTRGAPPRKTSSPGGKPSPARRGRPAGTRPRKKPRCGARCQRSVKPASTCDCSCGGRLHGSRITRAGVQSVEMQLQEKAAVRRERAARKATR
jgi:hypothetical protein